MRVEEIVAEKDGFGKWIPCSERLPENDTKYFNTCWDGEMSDKLALDKAIKIVKGGGIDE